MSGTDKPTMGTEPTIKHRLMASTAINRLSLTKPATKGIANTDTLLAQPPVRRVSNHKGLAVIKAGGPFER